MITINFFYVGTFNDRCAYGIILLIDIIKSVVKNRYLVGRHFTEIESSSADINRIPKNNRDKRHVQT